MSLINNLITRFPNGVSNRNVDNIFNSLRFPDQTMYHQFYDDFDRYTAANWVVTLIGTGTATLSSTVNGGALVLTTTAANGDAVALQNAASGFTMTPGSPCFFKARVAIGPEALADSFLIGLQVATTLPFVATDGIYFLKPAASTGLSFFVRKDTTTGSNSVANIATVVAATFLYLEWYYDGVDRVYYGVNGVILGYLQADATYLPDAILTPSFALVNGEAVVKTLTVDFLFAANER